jgi:hypothetical protein
LRDYILKQKTPQNFNGLRGYVLISAIIYVINSHTYPYQTI